MVAFYEDELNQYLERAESVVQAGQQLQALFNEPEEMRQFAIDNLERAAQDYGNEGTTYRNFMFSELESEKADKEPAVQGTLVSVLNDIQVANVLIASGQALGETGEVQDPEILRQTLRQLEETAQHIKQTLANFAEDSSTSDNRNTREIFRKDSEEALNTFVDEAANVATSIFDELSRNTDRLNIGDLLTRLASDILNQLSEVGRLIKQGVQFIKEAFNSLLRLLGEANLGSFIDNLKNTAKEIWDKFKESGSPLEQSIAWAFGVEDVRSRRDEKLLQNLNEQSLIDGSNELKELKNNFTKEMKIVGGLVIVTFSVSLLLHFWPDPTLLQVIIGLYWLLLLFVIFRGIDYTDSRGGISLVRGVGIIVDTLT
ncbi:MAG: hypothetical protein IM507_12540 [Microcystis sp. M20BS1]|uniref:hypothetical protein n=1 Tax=unclassified Microcystis TaxID=2643300 RepID=UPI00257A2E27|nr:MULTISPECIES: hypothetical protein [unclassified Microcystis]MCA2624926.1 hypothetical protein [Microcystis sp. M19BS1]MCA2633180.1 hypothetical protein [Microcystis sp. M20BS1]